jgi:hypothetical protein
MRNLGFGRPGLNPYIAEFVSSEILILRCVGTLAILFLVRVLVKISIPTLSVANVYWNWCIPDFYYHSLLFISLFIVFFVFIFFLLFLLFFLFLIPFFISHFYISFCIFSITLSWWNVPGKNSMPINNICLIYICHKLPIMIKWIIVIILNKQLLFIIENIQVSKLKLIFVVYKAIKDKKYIRIRNNMMEQQSR